MNNKIKKEIELIKAICDAGSYTEEVLKYEGKEDINVIKFKRNGVQVECQWDEGLDAIYGVQVSHLSDFLKLIED